MTSAITSPSRQLSPTPIFSTCKRIGRNTSLIIDSMLLILAGGKEWRSLIDPETMALPSTPNHSAAGIQVFSIANLTPRQRQIVTVPAYARGHAPIGAKLT